MALIRFCPAVLALLIAVCGAPAAVPKSKMEMAPTTSFDGSYQSAIHISNESETVKGLSWCRTRANR
jgi:hypothetical protein